MKSPPAQKSETVSRSIKFAGLYYLLIFVIMPLFSDVFSAIARLPLGVGVLMIALAIYDGRPLEQIRLSSQLFFLFSFFYVLSSLYGTDAPGAMEGIIMLFRQMGIGVVLVLAVRSTKDLEFMFKLFVWSGIISAIYGMLFIIPQLAPVGFFLRSLGLPSGRDANALRMIGVLNDPTYFGLSILPGFLISLNNVLRTRTQSGWLSIGSAILLFFAIILSFSRTTWAGMLVGILVLTGFTKNLFKAVMFVVVFILVMQITAMDDFLSAAMSENASRSTIDLSKQEDSRTYVWKAYFKLALENPLGYGMGSIETLRWYATWSVATPTAEHRPHNAYLIIWVEGGLQSLIPFMALLITSLKRSWSIRSYGDRVNKKDYGTLAVALIASMAVGLFSLGGMFQLLAINISLGLSIWYLKVDKQLVPVTKTTV
ncbi:MAG: O-antigen ligase family protein [Magnetococcus sp. YQC-5]